jgi:hypothetical protein
MVLTFSGAVEPDVELLHAIIDECHFVVRHQPVRQQGSMHIIQDVSVGRGKVVQDAHLHDIRLYTAFG